MWTFIIIAIVVLFAVGSAASHREDVKADKRHEAEMEEKGIASSSKLSLGLYIGGHPEIDNVVANVIAYPESGSIALYTKTYIQPDKKKLDKKVLLSHLGSINLKDIQAITVEDLSTIERNVTLGRFLLVGVAALAWKKKRKEEKAFLNIQWKEGNFSHNTLFEYSRSGSMSKANTNRNQLLRLIKNQ